MASLFTTSSRIKVKQPFVGHTTTPFFLQFVPGIVVNAVTDPTTIYGYGLDENANSIMALPHITNEYKKRREDVDEDDRYFPLFRGMYEVPSVGDPVLLCNIGGNKYYLGPLNTDNHANWNLDNLYVPEVNVGDVENRSAQGQSGGQTSSANFSKLNSLKRLAKRSIPQLDNSNTFNERHGDIMLEGRHGNSIRVGSRKADPYIFFSNNRPISSNSETIRDGSLISITSNGSLLQHFNQIVQKEAPVQIDGNDELIPIEILKETFGFTLASDDLGEDETPPNIFMGNLISSVNGDNPIEDEVYGYSDDQILLNSKKITLNTKLDDIYLSSNKDIHIGTKRHLTMSTNKNLIIESDKTYLGNPNKKTMDNMVLGKKLQEALKGIIDMIKTLQITTQLGPQSPLPLASEQQVTSLIDNILSAKHFIEE